MARLLDQITRRLPPLLARSTTDQQDGDPCVKVTKRGSAAQPRTSAPEAAVESLGRISGQRPLVTKAKVSSRVPASRGGTKSAAR